MKFLTNMVLVIAIIMIASTFTNGVAQYPKGNSDDPGEQGAPGWWHDWHRDANHNKIDDLIEDKPDDETFGIFINYDRHPEKDDVDRLLKFDIDVKYVYKTIDVICARDVNKKDAKEVALLFHVVMVKLEPKIYPMLDISSRAIKSRASDQYSPNTVEPLR